MKKRILMTLAILTILLFSVSALCYDEALLVGRTPFAYEKISVTTGTVSRLNATHRDSSGAVFLTIESNNIRYRIDGGNPSANDGHLVVAVNYQNIWLYDNSSIRNMRMIAIGGTATVIVTYYRRN